MWVAGEKLNERCATGWHIIAIECIKASEC
jgi:hypothetical protein